MAEKSTREMRLMNKEGFSFVLFISQNVLSLYYFIATITAMLLLLLLLFIIIVMVEAAEE